MARPRKPDHERRNAPRVGVRLNIIERAQIEQTAAAYGLGLSEFFRRRGLGVRLPAAAGNQQQIAETTTALFRLGVNLNQLTKHVNAGRGVPHARLADLIARINAAMDKLDEPD